MTYVEPVSNLFEVHGSMAGIKSSSQVKLRLRFGELQLELDHALDVLLQLRVLRAQPGGFLKRLGELDLHLCRALRRLEMIPSVLLHLLLQLA